MRDYFALLGIKDFLEKPIAKTVLLESVARVFDSLQHAAPPEAPRRVLVVGSDQPVVEKITNDLAVQGCHVDFVLSGDQAISKAVLFLPNIVLLQNEITEISAPEIIVILRKMPQFRKVPVLIFSTAVSGRAAQENGGQTQINKAVLIRRCLDEGAKEYVGCYGEELFLERIAKYIKKGSILIIDDDAGLVQLLRSTLEKEGFKVFAARDGKPGLESATALHPDIILLDIVMPDVDGYEVLARLKADPSTREIPVVMLTVKGQENEIQKALCLGADDYMHKPVCTDLLLKRINSFVGKG